jgi:hypothetical protein
MSRQPPARRTAGPSSAPHPPTSPTGRSPRAYPLQLSASVERAQAVADATPGRDLLATWALQAAADGALPALLSGLRAQPHLLSAYGRGALLRDQGRAGELEELLGRLKVWPAQRGASPQGPKDRGPTAAGPWHPHTGRSEPRHSAAGELFAAAAANPAPCLHPRLRPTGPFCLSL